jgi:hypothetical protein
VRLRLPILENSEKANVDPLGLVDIIMIEVVSLTYVSEGDVKKGKEYGSTAHSL